MKILGNLPSSDASLHPFIKHARRKAADVACAAAIMSLVACDSATLEGIQNDLANGEDVNINITVEDDDTVVINVEGSLHQPRVCRIRQIT